MRVIESSAYLTAIPASLSLLVTWGCSSELVEPHPSSNTPLVRLEQPAANYVIAQNDPAMGCAPHETRGYGFTVVFDWSDAPSGSAIGYELHAQREGSQYPIVAQFFEESRFVMTLCNAFVADHNLLGWGWQVRVVDQDGRPGEWSERRAFTFAPCRLDDGRPCFAPG